MKLLPLAILSTCVLVTALPARAQTSAQQLMSEAQTAYIRGDIETAKKDFELVLRIDPHNQVAINYLRNIRSQEAKSPRGNDQEKQLAAIIVPKVEFREATLGSALEYLRQQVTKLSNGKQSVNFVAQLPDEQMKSQAITLVLSNVPFTEVLRYLGTVANVQFEYQKYAVVVKPAGAPGTASTAKPAGQP
jgi:hypothetical protein